MNAGFYLRYSLRSLRRGGQRTVLAVFCIAVGVMAVVALQLASLMVEKTLESNVREFNGGDLNISSGPTPFTADDLAAIDALKRQGVITVWTGIPRSIFGSGRDGDNGSRLVLLTLVDPATYQVGGPIEIVQPAGGDFKTLVARQGSVVVSQTVFDSFGAKIGDPFKVNAPEGALPLKIAGVAADSGFSSAFQVYASQATAQPSLRAPIEFTTVYANVPKGGVTRGRDAVQKLFPKATITTIDDVFKSVHESVVAIRHLLQIAGLLALLVGGIGVVNTMQVLLSRRRIEVAMLKATGYRRRDLYFLFGTEAALLGLAGGVVGSVFGIGLSYAVKSLMENFILLRLTFVLDPVPVLSGLLVGVVTALIFGLLPIVRTASVRPYAVLRDLPETHVWRGRLGTVGLLALSAAAFTAFAAVILGDLLLAVEASFGTIVFLAILDGVFVLVVLIVGHLPVPDRFSVRHVLLVGWAVAMAAALTFLVPVIGALVLVFTLMGFVVVMLPGEWKSTTKMAFRALGRQRSRTSATLVALFVGVFTVGLLVLLGQDVRTKFDALVATTSNFNVVVLTTPERAPLIEAAQARLQGVTHRIEYDVAPAEPVAVGTETIDELVARLKVAGTATADLSGLAGLFGINVKIPPAMHLASEEAGRTLSVGDKGLPNVLAGAALMDPPLSLRPGAQVTVKNPVTKQKVVLTIVGFVSSIGSGEYKDKSGLFADETFVDTYGGPASIRYFEFKIDPAYKNAAIRALGRADPDALLLDISDFGAVFTKFLTNLITLLGAIASLALLAAIVIIANAVALAMLERRREIGIMKAVGYQSRGILAQVLLENALIGGIGGVSAIGVVAIALASVSRWLLHFDLNMNPFVALGIILVVMATTIAVAAGVAYSASRVRPLEVLRYE